MLKFKYFILLEILKKINDFEYKLCIFEFFFKVIL